MDFPATIAKKAQLTIPSEMMKFLDLSVGDQVIVSIRKKDSVETHKRTLEKPFRKGD